MKRILLFLLFFFCVCVLPSFAQKNKINCTAPTISAVSDVTICNGSSTTLTGNVTGPTSSPYTYNWTPTGSLSNPNVVTASTTTTTAANPATTTTYTLLITDGTGCPSLPATVSVSVNPTPTVTVAGNNTICKGSSTTLIASGASTYVWSPATGLSATNIYNPVANPTTSTNYTVVGTGANSCTNTITYSVTVNPTPTVTVSSAPNATICNGSSTTLTANGASTYAWSPATGLSATNIYNPVANPTTSTNYTVVGTSAASCTATATYSITVNPLPTANAGPDVSVCSGDNTTLNGTGNGTYLWSPNDGTLSCTTCPNPVSTPTAVVTYTLTVTNSCGTATDAISITYPALPSVNAGPDLTICNGGNTTIIPSGSGTFVWFPSTGLSCTSCANPVANPTVTTTYTVNMTGSCGTSSDNMIVNVNPLPTANAGTDPTICNGQSTTLNGTGTGTYVWSPSTGLSNTTIANPIAIPVLTTTYVISVTNSCGTSNDSVVVNVNPLPTISVAGNTTVCSGGSTTLTASGASTYVWSPPGGLSNPNISNPVASPTILTTYTVTGTNANGCSNTTTVTVNISTVTALIAGTNSICSGQNTTLTASGGGTYVWSTTSTATSIVVSPTSLTTYTVTATNAMGCTDTATMIVNVTPQPTAVVTANDSTVCAGTSATLTASGGTGYVWTPSTNLSNTTISNPTATPIITTTYTVIVSSGSCKDTTNITITVNPLPTASITATPSVLICVGNNTTLTASGGGTYIWSTTSTAASIVVSPTIATNYIVTVTNANGCTKSDAVNVNVLQQVSASILGTSNICEGSSTVLTAQGGSIYTWSPGGATASVINVSPSANTCYSVTVSNGACSDDTSICVTVVSASTFSVNAGPDQTLINVGAQATLTGSSSSGTYNWSPATGLSCSTCANPVVNPTVTTTYTLTTTVGSCSSIDSVTVYVNMDCGNVFVPNAFSPNGDGKNDFISIRSSCIKTINFVIYDRWGNRVFESTDVTIVNDPKNGWDGYYHGKLMDAAVFFYTLNVEMINNETKVYKGNITLVR